jgi:anti-sigma regulatory factor (Ser/Thr protein kinase)
MSSTEGHHRPDVDYEFERGMSAPREVRNALLQLRWNGVRTDDVMLVASELVTNVVLHTQHGGRVLAWNSDPVRLEVHDTSPRPPVVTDTQPGGRGLRIIDAICSSWGTTIVPTGKVVWAEFGRPSHDGGPSPL